MLIQGQIHEIKGSVSTLENVTPPPNFPYTVGRELQNKYIYQWFTLAQLDLKL